MANLDELFKKPSLPSQKRKFDAPKDPNEIYKSAKLDTNGHARGAQSATVEDEEEDIAGPELPPDLEDEDGDADEDGRFFGGGLSNGTRDVLDFVNEQDEDNQFETIDSTWLRKTAVSFEKKINKNAALRAKFENEPEKFMASEADLDSSIQTLSILSEHPELYAEFTKLGCIGSLVSLLSHENTDIAIAAIEIIGELIDEDVNAESEQWDALVAALLEADIIDLLHANFSRLNENQETDRSGVYHILEVLESLASSVKIADQLGAHGLLIPWLLKRSTIKEDRISQNKQYAAEVLSILLQSSSPCREHFVRIEGIDLFLQALSAYRKRDPDKDSEEEEFVENLFDSVACTLDEKAGKDKFLEAEGVELCLIMVKEGKMSRPRALRLLDHSASGLDGGPSCEKIIEAAGLKPLFAVFIKAKQDKDSTEHLLGIFTSMLRSLPGESAPRIRLLAKFIEKDYEKIDRLLQLRTEYSVRLSSMDMEIEGEKQKYTGDDLEDLSATWLSRRLDAGLFELQAIDTILAWLIAEDDGVRRKKINDEDIAKIKRTLQEQLVDLAEANTEEETVSKDILTTLISFLH